MWEFTGLRVEGLRGSHAVRSAGGASAEGLSHRGRLAKGFGLGRAWCGVCDLGFGDEGLGSRVQGAGFRVWGVGVWRFGVKELEVS